MLRGRECRGSAKFEPGVSTRFEAVEQVRPGNRTEAHAIVALSAALA
jgi:hypothetical protein